VCAYDITSGHIRSHHVTSHHNHFITSHHNHIITSHHITLHNVRPHHITSRHEPLALHGRRRKVNGYTSTTVLRVSVLAALPMSMTRRGIAGPPPYLSTCERLDTYTHLQIRTAQHSTAHLKSRHPHLTAHHVTLTSQLITSDHVRSHRITSHHITIQHLVSHQITSTYHLNSSFQTDSMTITKSYGSTSCAFSTRVPSSSSSSLSSPSSSSSCSCPFRLINM